ncbi:uncharacterized protein LOC115210761 [Argonauta hians]
MRLSSVGLLMVVMMVAFSSYCDGAVDMAKIRQKIHDAIDKGIGGKFKHFFDPLSKYFKEYNGTFQIDGTPLTINYFADDCEMKFGRKRFMGRTICPADVTEIITNTKRHCETDDQKSAVVCATKLVLEEIMKNAEIGRLLENKPF